MKRCYILIAAVWVCISWAGGLVEAAPLDGAVWQLLRSRDLRSTRYSVCVIDADRGELLAEVNADEPMIPASNMKLITTAAALDVLGKDFVFRTELGVVDRPDETWLMIKGDGDPALGDPVLLKEAGLTAEDLLNQWVSVVKAAGITRVARLIVDDRVFDHQFVHPNWPREQLNRDYCAQVAGINFHDNCLHVLPAPADRVGTSPTFSVYPESPFLTFFNSATTGVANQFWVDRKPGTNELTMRGRVKSTFYRPVRVTLHDPPMWLGGLLKDRLERAGVTVESVSRPKPTDPLLAPEPLHRVETVMSAVLRRTNRDSENLFAEALLKRMGNALTGSPGSWENGAAAVRHALNHRLGTLSSAAVVSDGSGLSRENRVTARLLAELLHSMHRDDNLRPIYLESLSYDGRVDSKQREGDGTLDGRFKKLPVGHFVYGKSGYIRGVSTLSGYLIMSDPDAPDNNQRTIAFSMLFNEFTPPLTNQSMKNIQQKLIELIDQEIGTLR
ncbi:MAG: D-alanyl-D-alanine carboxypeptidase/D-alanyl-D-alanine-endopeptidase [Phycisphaeraceae bacterium]